MDRTATGRAWRRWGVLLTAGASLTLVGCEGVATLDPSPGRVSPGDGTPGGGGGAASDRAQFTCSAGTEGEGPADVPLPRLSRTQYVNTVRDLVQRALPQDAEAVLKAVAPLLDGVPPDSRVGAPGERRGGFSVADQSLQQARADATYALAEALGRELTSSASRRAALLGPCATDASTSNDAGCLAAFVQSFGARVFRRPLDGAEVDFLTAAAGSTPVSAAALADVVGLLFASPHLVFFVEHGTDDAAPVAPLSAYELASRLSYHFWRTLPDDALWEAAATGALLTPDGLKAQVDRLASSPRAAETWSEFFSEWFGLEELEELDGLLTSPKFQTFAGADLPTADTREAAIEDVVEMVKWTVAHGGSLSALLTERRSFARDELLARLYGARPWNGVEAPTEPLSAQRAGLLTRVAFLASGGVETRPILKGARIRNSLMCQSIQLPEGNVAAVAPKPSATATTREVVETLTETPPACAGCHKQLINPLGFSTENFDALGRERSVQPLFDEAGTKVGERPIDTRTVPALVSLDDTTVSEGPVDLTRMLDESGRIHSCFARQYFRFVNRRVEDVQGDGCALAEVEQATLEGLPLVDLFKLPALRPDFQRRSFR